MSITFHNNKWFVIPVGIVTFIAIICAALWITGIWKFTQPQTYQKGKTAVSDIETARNITRALLLMDLTLRDDLGYRLSRNGEMVRKKYSFEIDNPVVLLPPEAENNKSVKSPPEYVAGPIEQLDEDVQESGSSDPEIIEVIFTTAPFSEPGASKFASLISTGDFRLRADSITIGKDRKGRWTCRISRPNGIESTLSGNHTVNRDSADIEAIKTASGTAIDEAVSLGLTYLEKSQDAASDRIGKEIDKLTDPKSTQFEHEPVLVHQ
jgi:hypothetical protein